MHVVEHLDRAKDPLVSVEIVPPRRGSDIRKLYKAVESVAPFNPPFIDVTSHSAEIQIEEQADGSVKRTVRRKSPGTFGLCAYIKHKYNIDPVPHILCTGFTREETEDYLIDLEYTGIDNILAIRGDGDYQPPMPEGCSCNKYALDLVGQIAELNRGVYQAELKEPTPTNFCIGVTAYPEKHFEAPNMAFDIQQLLRKQEAGANYAVTQMFFDNQRYFEFKRKAEEAGVTIPIIPGLKVLTKKRHLSLIPSIFHTDLPEELVEAIHNAKDDKVVQDIGVDFAVRQSLELLEHGEKALHFYIMQYTKPFVRVREALSKQLV